jgi:predicted nucleic acid-binding protein
MTQKRPTRRRWRPNCANNLKPAKTTMPDSAWLLDTSILIDLLRGAEPARVWIDSLPEAERVISVITAAELLAGCRSQRDQRIVERELALYQKLGIDEATSFSALELYQRLRLTHGVGFFDCLIAATAQTRRLRVATLNLKHFRVFGGVAEKPY